MNYEHVSSEKVFFRSVRSVNNANKLCSKGRSCQLLVGGGASLYWVFDFLGHAWVHWSLLYN